MLHVDYGILIFDPSRSNNPMNICRLIFFGERVFTCTLIRLVYVGVRKDGAYRIKI